MASKMFMKLGDKIKGESTEHTHKGSDGWIEILSFSHGVSQTIAEASGTGGRTGAGASFTEFSVMKSLDASSPDIMLHCATGKSIPKVEVHFCQSIGDDEGKLHPFLKYEMEKVIVSAYSPSGGSDGSKPMESIGLSYGTIKEIYHPIGHDQEPKEEVIRGYNCDEDKVL